jgi:hypothetical protein
MSWLTQGFRFSQSDARRRPECRPNSFFRLPLMSADSKKEAGPMASRPRCRFLMGFAAFFRKFFGVAWALGQSEWATLEARDGIPIDRCCRGVSSELVRPIVAWTTLTSRLGRQGRFQTTPWAGNAAFRSIFHLHVRRSGTISAVRNCNRDRPPSPSPARGRPSRGATGHFASCASSRVDGNGLTRRRSLFCRYRVSDRRA